MKIWDKYISKNFFSYFIVFLIGVVFLYIIVDLIENLDKFIDNKARPIDIFKYYSLYIPYIVIFVLPIVCVISCGVCCGIITRNREIIALENGGVSRARAGISIIVLGFLLSIIVLILANLVVPNANRKKNQFKSERILKRKTVSQRTLENVIYQGEKGVIVFIRHYQVKSNRGEGISIQILENNRLKERYDADSFSFRGNFVVLGNGFKRIFAGEIESTSVFKKYTLKLKLPSDVFERALSSDEMTTSHLVEFIRKNRSWGFVPLREQVDLYIRFSFPFSNLILLLITLPLSLKHRRYSIFSGIGYSFIILFLYYSSIRAAQALGYDGALKPIAAGIGPSIIFLLIGMILYKKY